MSYPIFTEEMKKDYTILVPTMLPTHFKLILNVMKNYGYKMELLENEGKAVIDNGLKYVHNDTCYPAQVVIGQLIDAIESGKYDIHKIALLISQTGGGCRASNYIHLLRKALENAGYGFIPVISLNFSGLESEHTGFKITLPIILKMFYCIEIADLMMSLRNQCLPYEINKGDTFKLEKEWFIKASEVLCKPNVKQKDITKLYKDIVVSFNNLPLDRSRKVVKVGIVGEIFVKFSPLGNNDLEEFLYSEGAEVSMAGSLDFCLYCIYNNVLDYKLYKKNKKTAIVFDLVYKYILHIQRQHIRLIEKYSFFAAPTPFDKVVKLSKGYVGFGTKMGEGWLLTSEMLELIDKGVNNIICAQPFGCLPNHIVGKGMMKLIKENNLNANLVAIDYDASASKVNQENRIKLMLATARTNLE